MDVLHQIEIALILFFQSFEEGFATPLLVQQKGARLVYGNILWHPIGARSKCRQHLMGLTCLRPWYLLACV